jgi:bifunctional DNA-binding transcriptional regulator/antitoxin component of YhaV-PrlF toxin-antitoxin module
MPAYKNPGTIEFDAEIKYANRGGEFVLFPHDTQELFGTKGRVPVNATFDGIPYQGSLANMGYGGHMLGILKAIREQLGKGEGDVVHVTVELDDKPRVVELSDDIIKALKDANLYDAFRAMAYTHQREYMQWIEGAKQAETRQRRIQKTVDMVREKAK